MKLSWAIGLLTPLALFAATGVNALLGLMAVSVLAIGGWLLWRPGHSPIFAFIFGYQWLQASTKVFELNLYGHHLDDYSQFGGDLSTATALSLTGLVFLAAGMHLGLGKSRQLHNSTGALSLEDKPPLYWFWVCAAAFATSLAAQAAASQVRELSQPLLALASLRWAFYWMLAQVALRNGGAVGWLWALFFCLELGLGITGYFSDFKTVLFYSMLAVVSSGIKMTPVRVLAASILLTTAVVMAIGWTAIKTEQRRFLSDGERAQVVRVSTQDSLANIVTLASQLDLEAMTKAAGLLATRIAYVDFFARVLDTVPSDIPHEDGALWADAVARPFMPRLIFPNKTAIDDSARTNEFTNLNVSGADEGTSISLGYMAEAYIDFGAWLMMLPILALGWSYGRFYRWMVNYRYSRGVVGMGLATATLYPAAYLETSITKLIGGLVVAGLVAWLIARVLVPLMRSGRPKKTQPSMSRQ
ncbi:MAG: hypothetical protein Q8R63_10350 [Ramlibacter sp.]|nr:hypothetical protein [Ramlibacter sp.]